ncbi:cupin domain-containing protein [Streptomyces sp. UG1]|uniref:cupin domain-containing protein n=1 Tax=Streptomyces sp. UG1 TaxID=3417652 RepID=UPI003CF26CBA
MSLLKAIDPNPSFAPRESGPLPERLISGNPTFRTWAQDVASGESIHTGVWEATPGDSFVMKPGYVGVWKTIETVRKIYVTVM